MAWTKLQFNNDMTLYHGMNKLQFNNDMTLYHGMNKLQFNNDMTLYHGMNKLQFNNDMTMMYNLTTTIRWIFLVLVHWNNSSRVDMSLHSDTLS